MPPVNRLIAASSVGPSSTVTYTYYPAGQRATDESAAGARGYSYDAAERLVSLDAEEGSYAWAYSVYNGLAETVQYPNGLECRYAYDVMNRPTNIMWRDVASNVVRSLAYSYSDAGMITRITREDASHCDYEYDTLDRLVREQKYDTGAVLALETEYRYDLTGNRTQKVSAAGAVNYEYGSGNRMSGWGFAATGAVEVYVDVHGHASEPIGTDPRWGERTVNELSVEVSGTNFWVSDVPLGAGTQELVAAISDEAGNVGRTTNTVVVKIATNGAYQFDFAGNVTNIAYGGLGTVGLAWDGWYMLKSVATNGATAESYTYDAYGRRVTITKGTNTLCLVYDGPHCIAEVDTNGVPVRSYTYGPGIDNVLAMTVHQPEVRTYYYIKDHLRSVLALTDESGALVESYSYDAWGRVLAVYDAAGTEISESAVGNRILWQGREYSWSTGLYYFRARWYDPVTGRWLSNDPIDVLGGLNQYAFCGDNPINARDPLGLDGINFTTTNQTSYLHLPTTSNVICHINSLPNACVTSVTMQGHGSYQNIVGFIYNLGPPQQYIRVNAGGMITMNQGSNFAALLQPKLAPGATITLQGCHSAGIAQALSQALPGHLVTGYSGLVAIWPSISNPQSLGTLLYGGGLTVYLNGVPIGQ